MQNRSKSYQGVISFTTEAGSFGINYQHLVAMVGMLIDEEVAYAHQIKQLTKEPSEANAETTAKGQKALARKLIDQARRQGLIYYTPKESPERNDNRRRVHTARRAWTGGVHGSEEVEREATLHKEFYRYLRARQPD